MRAKECFRRCEAGILRSLRQARPNKKAERRLKQCGVVPRENHDIRLPPQQKARAPTKKKTATRRPVGGGPRPAEAYGPAPRPSGPPLAGGAQKVVFDPAADAWDGRRALRGDQGPQARAAGPRPRRSRRSRGASSRPRRRPPSAVKPRPSLGSRRSPRSSRGGQAPTRGATRRATSGRAASVKWPQRARTNTTHPRDRGRPNIDYTTSPLLMVEKGCSAGPGLAGGPRLFAPGRRVRSLAASSASAAEGQKEAGRGCSGSCSFWAGSAPSRTRTRPLPSLECSETHQKLCASIGLRPQGQAPARPRPAGANASKSARDEATVRLKANDGRCGHARTFSRDWRDDDWTDATCGSVSVWKSFGGVSLDSAGPLCELRQRSGLPVTRPLLAHG